MEEDVLRGLTETQLNELIDQRIEERIRYRGITQNDILPQTIKERHIDWEEFGVAVANSVREAIGNSVQNLEATAFSTTVNNGDDFSILATVSDNTDNADRIIDGVILVTAYESTQTAANAIPWGSALAPGDYVRHTAHDFERTDGKTLTLVDYVDNNSGGNNTIIWDLSVRYLGRDTA